MWFSRDSDSFTNQVIVITGGSRGIGFVTAQAFLEKGAKVAFCARNPATLSAAEQQLKRYGELKADLVDVRDGAKCEAFIGKGGDRFGRTDVLVNNAGRAYSGELAQQSRASIDEIIDVNIKGVLYMTHAVLPLMQAQRSGVIINVSSGAGLSGFAGLVSYCTSKFGVVGFGESLAQEVDRYGIRVYTICPGRVATDMQQEVSGRKVGMPPEKVAGKILQLAGSKPPIASGKYLVVYE